MAQSYSEILKKYRESLKNIYLADGLTALKDCPKHVLDDASTYLGNAKAQEWIHCRNTINSQIELTREVLNLQQKGLSEDGRLNTLSCELNALPDLLRLVLFPEYECDVHCPNSLAADLQREGGSLKLQSKLNDNRILYLDLSTLNDERRDEALCHLFADKAFSLDYQDDFSAMHPGIPFARVLQGVVIETSITRVDEMLNSTFPMMMKTKRCSQELMADVRRKTDWSMLQFFTKSSSLDTKDTYARFLRTADLLYRWLAPVLDNELNEKVKQAQEILKNPRAHKNKKIDKHTEYFLLDDELCLQESCDPKDASEILISLEKKITSLVGTMLRESRADIFQGDGAGKNAFKGYIEEAERLTTLIRESGCHDDQKYKSMTMSRLLSQVDRSSMTKSIALVITICFAPKNIALIVLMAIALYCVHKFLRHQDFSVAKITAIMPRLASSFAPRKGIESALWWGSKLMHAFAGNQTRDASKGLKNNS